MSNGRGKFVRWNELPPSRQVEEEANMIGLCGMSRADFARIVPDYQDGQLYEVESPHLRWRNEFSEIQRRQDTNFAASLVGVVLILLLVAALAWYAAHG